MVPRVVLVKQGHYYPAEAAVHAAQGADVALMTYAGDDGLDELYGESVEAHGWRTVRMSLCSSKYLICQVRRICADKLGSKPPEFPRCRVGPELAYKRLMQLLHDMHISRWLCSCS